MLPGLVFGPPLAAEHGATQSVHVMRRILRGDMAPGWVGGWVGGERAAG
jgi:hypothetical protein